jgi:hypothetical protein
VEKPPSPSLTDEARAMRERAEGWRARAGAFANVMLGLMYLAGAWFVWKIGTLIWTELNP